ncbi:MAG: hypothetical protein QFX32_05875 [Methanolinea sp.]|nr:hypothetical protein [Methanolinea sp.]
MHAKSGGRMQWLWIEPGDRNGIDDYFERVSEREREQERVMIGGWEYFLYSDGKTVALCRTKGCAGRPWLTEVVPHEAHGISDEDLELAVRYWTGGAADPGSYRVSSHIEKKLRALLE